MRYRFDRGETIQIALDVIDGEIPEGSEGTAHLREVVPGEKRPRHGARKAAEFVISLREATEDDLGGWTLTLDADTSKALRCGLYYADFLLTVAGGVVITDGVEVEILEPATVLA